MSSWVAERNSYIYFLQVHSDKVFRPWTHAQWTPELAADELTWLGGLHYKCSSACLHLFLSDVDPP